MFQRLTILLFTFITYTATSQGMHPYVQILGVAQDGGYPHMGCEKKCCSSAWGVPEKQKFVVALALVDPIEKKWWLFEATPDIKEQLHYFHVITKGEYNYLPDGIFITHAHIGHYAGLMQLGREAMNTRKVPVYVMPKMKHYLETNGPWSQLVSLDNIALQTLDTVNRLHLPDSITVAAFTVPHRDEYSETTGFKICTQNKKYLFIPDINKWEKWNKSIVAEVCATDIALVDATCFDDGELPGRNMKVIQHPNVTETMARFANTDITIKNRIHFIHINHTNPLMWDATKKKEVEKAGYHIACQGERL